MVFRLAALGMAVTFVSSAWAQEALAAQTLNGSSPLTAESYILPPKLIEKVVRAPWHLNASVSNLDPAGERWIRVQSEGMPRLANLSEPYANLAGLDVDTTRNCTRSWTIRRVSGLTVKSLRGDKDVVIEVPEGVSPNSVNWSPDGQRIAFIGMESKGAYIYLADPKSGKCKKLLGKPLLATAETQIHWRSDSKAICGIFIPSKRPENAGPSAVPTSPSVRVTDKETNGLRTFPTRLENIDEANRLRYFITGQLGVVTDAGRFEEVGSPEMITDLSPSPSFDAFQLSIIRGSFLYIYPMDSFPRATVIWDAAGKQVLEIRKPTGPDEKVTPKPEDRRSYRWDPAGRGLLFQQRSPEKEGKRKDSVYLWPAPFEKDKEQVLLTSDSDITSFILLPDLKRALITQAAGGETVLGLAEIGGSTSKKILSYKGSDFYANPGSPVQKDGPAAGSVLRTSPDGTSMYLSGVEYSKEPDKKAPRPFIDVVSFADGSKKRLWQSSPDRHETGRMLDDSGEKLLVTRQSPTEIGNDYLVNLASKSETALSANRDFVPEVSQLRRERVQITRADGIKFWVEVTLPKYALSGEGRKAFFWFYPSETRSQATYDEGQRTRNINAFRRTSPASPEILALLGYVVVNPDLPIVGTADRPNDTYITQLRNSLYAIIDELDRQHLIDRRYLAIGGHSYGAFSTANAMVNTPFFKAGIAGDGNYNRTLTPFGFQAEPRKLWESREVYLDMSPILKADQITGALLMYHGMADQNVGTFPINSYRMFDALEALGKTAALYVYPHEDHGQVALETRLDMWARWIAWLETYVK